jgi:hypothetical protein
MTHANRFKAFVDRFLPVFAAAAVLGTAGGYTVHQYMTDGCCFPGSPCCHPGSPCCSHHAAPTSRPLAMK